MRGGWVENGTVLIQLTRQHFAFYRGYLEGVDLRALASRYLETMSAGVVESMDLHVVQSRVKWVRDQLLVAARRAGKPTIARLVAIEPERLIVQYVKPVPTLEEFREERDPYEMFPEAELIELFQEEYGSGSRREARFAARNARLRTKQHAALRQLEVLVAIDPKLSDGVTGWLDPTLATRLKAAHITTLQHLVDAISGFGYRWYTKVPRIGEKAAGQIVHWLTYPETAAALGVTIHARGLKTRSERNGEQNGNGGQKVPAMCAPRTGIVPISYRWKTC